MKIYVVIVFFLVTFVTYAECEEYQWGETGPDDYLIADDKVLKHSLLFKIPIKKYDFKQKKGDKLTISGISVINKKGKCKATVELTKGGPGKKTASLKFKGKRGNGFKCYVKIWGNK